MSFRSVYLRGAALVAVASWSFSSFGQTSNPSAADKSAARDLYAEGFKLQDQGKYEQALDRYNRADALYPAVTTELHIAECQAALGKLVESAETYRQVINAQLPADATPAFHAAQAQAKAELPQVEPRIPLIEIDVTPPDAVNAPGLEVTLDGKPVKSAVFGVHVPIDPGPHHLTAHASGYAPTQADIAVKERNKDAQVTLNLVATPGANVVAPVAGTGTPAPVPAPYSATDAPPSKYSTPQAPESQTWRAHRPPTSVIFGGRLGLNTLTGSLYDGKSSFDKLSVGVSAGVELGLRFADYFFFEGVGEAVAYAPGSDVASDADASTHSEMLGAILGVMSGPHSGAGVMAGIGVGYRWLHSDVTGALGDIHDNESFGGTEFLFTTGVPIRPTKGLLLLPRLDFGFGHFSKFNFDCSTGSSCPTGGNTAGHTAFMIGMGAYFDGDVGKPK